MLRQPTVLVLGAGSSVDFGLPTGEGLQSAIADMTDFRFDFGRQIKGSQELFEAVAKQFDPPRQEVADAGHLITRGLATSRSIDDYLFNHGGNDVVVRLGKAAIALAVSEAEQKSPLRVAWYTEHEIDPTLKRLEKSWAARLFSHLQTGVRVEELERLFENLTIITFNYDRCVEEYLFLAIQRAYSVPEARAAEVMATLRIYRPYGRIGCLAWQRAAHSQIPFGGTLQRDRLTISAAAIRTFTEQTHDPEEVESWRAPLRQARQIAFLGFGFHSQNMDLLNVQTPPNGTPIIYATVHGTSPTDQDVFRERIEPAIYAGRPHASRPEFYGGTCSEFMAAYGLRLVS